MYQHRFNDGRVCDFPVGKVVCVGRNFAEHIAELNNATPEEPLLFNKTNNCLVELEKPFAIPDHGDCHNELELAFLLSKPLRNATKETVLDAIAGVGLALDLTLRDVQSQLKEKGLPWERAKSFDGSCPVSVFTQLSAEQLQQTYRFSLEVNGKLRQQGDSSHMLWPWPELIAEISGVFSLYPGDIVLTGTPKGVGRLQSGDKLQLKLDDFFACETSVK